MEEREAEWSWRRTLRAARIATVSIGVGMALGYALGHEKVPTSPSSALPSPRLTDQERALLAPLTEGGRLGDFDLTEIHPSRDTGTVELVCRKEHAEVRLEIALLAAGSPAPPATAGRYAVYYSLRDAQAVDGEALAAALARVLQANAGLPVPEPLKSFRPPPGSRARAPDAPDAGAPRR